MNKNKELDIARGLQQELEESAQSDTNSLDQQKASTESSKHKITWDLDEDNCGIDPLKNPCGDANEY
jgi:hypothetical protein